ncbi:MAG: acyl-CoA dehydrogenase family protein [Burkholderiaceae bacterium]
MSVKHSPNDRLRGTLSSAEQQLLDATSNLVRDTIGPMAAQWEAERTMAIDALRQAGEIGITRMQVPESHGGMGASFRTKAAVAELLAQADFGFSMSAINTHNVAAKLAIDAPESVAAEFVPDLIRADRIGCTALTEPGAGSDFSSIATTAVKDGSGWRINGHKAWITNAAQASVVVMYVQTDPNRGGNGIAGFVIDGRRAGFSREPAYVMAGQHSIGAGGFLLTDYQATGDELILAPGEAFKSALGSINGARIYVAAMCCGMLASALDSAAQYGLSRQTFGVNLHGHQGWRWTLSEAAAELYAAQQLVDSVAARLDAGEDLRFEAAKTKVFATRMAERHLGAMMQAMGAEGLRARYPLARHQVGVRMAGFVDGSTEILLDRIASEMSK